MTPTSSQPDITVSNVPLWKLAWRRMRRRPFQYILFVIGVAIGVAMMVSIDLANGSAQRAFELSTDAVTGRTTHRIVPATPNQLDETIYRNVRTELGYQLAAPVVEAYVNVNELGDQPMRLVGIDPFAEAPFRSYFAGDGGSPDRLTALLTRPSGIIIGQDLAETYGLSVGDAITLNVSGRPVAGTLVGILAADDDTTRRALQGLLFADVASAQEILQMQGRLSHIDLIVPEEANLSAIQAVLPPSASIESAASQQNAIQQMSAAFELNLTALSLLALVVGMFLIYNTVTFSVVQRRRMFGILRCLGVTGGQLFRLILTESIVLALIGSLLGVGLGILLGRGTVRLITQTINDFYFVVNVENISISAESLIRGVLVGVAAAILATLPPALEAARTAPNATLKRSTLESRIQKLLPWLWLAWGVLSLAGVALLRVGTNLVLAFAGLFAILIGAALLTPAITAVLMRVLTPIGNAVLGVLGRMAPRDIVRSLSRTSVAIAALMTAVSVIVGVSIMVGSFRGTVVQWLDQTLQADVFVSPPSVTANRVGGKLDSAVVETLANWPGVEELVWSNSNSIVLPELERVVNLIAVEGDVSRGERPYAWQRDPDEDPWQALEAGNGVVISEALVLKENLSIPPEPIVLDTAEGPRSFEVVAIFYDYASDQGSIFIHSSTYRELWQDDSIASVGLFMEPGVDVDAAVAELQRAFSGRDDVVVQSNQGLREGSLEIFDRTFAITSALRLLAVVVAFIGVLSALLSLQLERTRELGVLRATGMTVRQLWSLTLLETGLMGTTAGLLAMPVGYVMAWILIYVINVRSFGWTLQMDLAPAYFLQAFFVAVVAALLAGIYPALRLGQMVIASAVREE